MLESDDQFGIVDDTENYFLIHLIVLFSYFSFSFSFIVS